jgi:hypothetical protein
MPIVLEFALVTDNREQMIVLPSIESEQMRPKIDGRGMTVQSMRYARKQYKAAC